MATAYPGTAPAAAGGPAGRVVGRLAWGLGVLAVLLTGYAALHGRFPFPDVYAALPDRYAWVEPAALFDRAYAWVVANRNTSPLFLYGFNYLSVGLGSAVVLINQALTLLAWPGVVLLGVLAAWRVAGGRVALLVLAAFAVFGLTGLWNEAMTTLALITTSVLIALLVGIPIGIAAGRSERVERLTRPVLDFMQIMPAFAYLMPMLLLFGIGNPAAAVATAVYAVPPAVRITAMAVRDVDAGAVEATTSLGSTPWQLLTKVRLPLARRTILLGVNQTIMLATSMVVIASVIGAGGLGDAVYQALNKVDVGRAFEAGVAIVLMAIALDRVTAAAGSGGAARELPPGPRRWRRAVLGAGTLLALGAAAGRLAGVGWLAGWPDALTVSAAGLVNAANDGVQALVGTWAAGFAAALLAVVLDPLRTLLTDSPWWLVVLAAAAIGHALGGVRTALVGGAAILLTGLLGVWEFGMDTLSQVIVAALVTVSAGFVAGVLAARSDRLAAVLRPLLDAMQTLPPFVYLIPVVALFGIGRVPALAAAVVYALPPVIRLVNDGIRGCSAGAVEAAVSQGSSRWQLLTKVQLPLARSSLLLAVNQGIMMVLAMVVIGALVGAGALGYGVVFGMAQNQLGLGMTSGLAIVCLGLLLDRMTQSAART
ncbi:ABC transporter permease [Marinitenerispora sediminis]|uniref:Choline ABC transporter permease n=1 Tax=Marinitenerispora sediminis TaxID=1931232 RepID=A0A368TAM8_9ACTN|nr:ABC transporter permease subunit [Marinitenerispora sediminis]RCV50785.1 choline ABC transporter permease [Marinitenerispora sediminis]RCV55038.1 choline ABC transporter permease [Marinitenerispora sediminis]RCV62077.1 choline ABC transporter permease [Marinitenerispora sediminis]